MLLNFSFRLVKVIVGICLLVIVWFGCIYSSSPTGIPRQSKHFGRYMYSSPLPWLQRKKKHAQTSQPLVLATSLSFACCTVQDRGHCRARVWPSMCASARHEVVIGRKIKKREKFVFTESSTIHEILYPRKFPATRYLPGD